MKNIFKQIISNFHEKESINIKKRELTVPLNTDKIISIIGPRRSGKSYFLYGIINNLIKSGVKKNNIIYINFEDERIDIKGNELQVLIDAYLELYQDTNLEDCYFFFDEIQNIDGWEKFIRRIYDEGLKNIFITGSNAKLLSKEIATALRGRSLSYELLPLSFKEFVFFKGKDINTNTSKGKAAILNLQTEFLNWGGFPEIINFNEDLKIKTLQEYFEVMLYNDIIERYKIKNTIVLKTFVKHLIQSSTKEYSINKINNNMKSSGLRFNQNDLYSFIEHLDTIYFSKNISKYEYSFNKQTLKKIYLVDNGFLNAISFNFSNNYGKLLENAMFIELYRKHGNNIFFLKNGSETDFIINEKDKIVFQVCYDLNEENYDREIKGCLDGMKKFNINTSFIITSDKEDEIVIEDKIIKLIPFYNFCLKT